MTQPTTDLGEFDFESGEPTIDIAGPEAIPADQLKSGVMRDAMSDPAHANAAAALAEGPDDTPTPVMRPEPEGGVTLNMGHMVGDHRVVDAIVREMNGADEEAISKSMTSGNVVRFIDVVVHRATVGLGLLTPGKEMDEALDHLTIGDRDLLVMAVRRATYGDTLTLTKVECPYCEETMTITYNVSPVADGGDVPVRSWEDCPGIADPTQREFEVEMPSGRVATMKLIDGAVHKVVFTPDNEKKAMGEINTLILREVVLAIDGKKVKTMEQVRDRLSMGDRRHLLQWLSENQPGPQYGEVVQECVECKREFPLVVDVLTLFRFV